MLVYLILISDARYHEPKKQKTVWPLTPSVKHWMSYRRKCAHHIETIWWWPPCLTSDLLLAKSCKYMPRTSDNQHRLSDSKLLIAEDVTLEVSYSWIHLQAHAVWWLTSVHARLVVKGRFGRFSYGWRELIEMWGVTKVKTPPLPHTPSMLCDQRIPKKEWHSLTALAWNVGVATPSVRITEVYRGKKVTLHLKEMWK